MTAADRTATASKDPRETSEAKAVFQHIVVATDFSDASRRALCDALALADENRAQLSVVHVLPRDHRLGAFENPSKLDRERMDAERRIQSLVAGLHTEQKIDAVVLKHGLVAQAVASMIASNAVDLLIIGTRGRSGLRKLALGSVAEELLRLSPCPVMTIGPRGDIAAITHGPGFGRILFATDFGKGSASALPLALALAKAYQARLILLHMIPPMPATTGGLSAYAPAGAAADELQEWVAASRQQVIQKLRESVPAESGLSQEPEYMAGTDFFPEGILNVVDKFKVDLIVMGANRIASARAAAHIPWSAVHEVVRRAACPVLTVAG